MNHAKRDIKTVNDPCRHTFGYRLAFAAILTGVVLALPVTSAPAARDHIFGGQFGGAGTGNGQLKEPEGVALNEATGDVYVVDYGNSRVEVFSSAGTFQGQFDGSGTFEVEGKVETGTAAPDGPLVGVNTGSIAIDNSCHLQKLTEVTIPTCKEFDPSNGDVYVTSGEYNHGVIDKFSATGAYLGQIAESLTEELEGVAVDANGGLWVARVTIGGAGSEIGTFSNAEPNVFGEYRSLILESSWLERGLAIDSKNNFYVRTNRDGGKVAEFDSSSEVLNKNAGGESSAGIAFYGIATNASTNDVYIDDIGTVGRFGSFSAGGAPEVERFGAGHLSSGNCEQSESLCRGGIAVNSATSQVYVADSSDVIQQYILEPPSKPAAGSESVSDVTAESATFSADINPRSEPTEESTTYRFEYGACALPAACATNAYEHTVPSPNGVLAPNYESDAVTIHIGGLAPHTTYHFRVVATNARGTVEGGEQIFTTQGSGGPLALPDGREWEMVSPPDKFGAALLGQGVLNRAMQASIAGDAITYLATAPTEAEPDGNSNLTQVLSLRRSDGWGSRDINIPHSEATAYTNEYSEYPYFSEDISLAILQPFRAFNPSLSGEASEQTAYLRTGYLHGDVNDRCVESCYDPLVTGAPGFENVPPETEFGICEGATCARVNSNRCPPAFRCGPQFEVATPNLDHIVIRSQIPLTPGAPSSGTYIEDSGLYEWSAGQLTYVGQGAVGNVEQEPERSAARHGISDDGSRVVIIGESEGLKGLLMRDTTRDESVKLDAVQGGVGTGNANPVFQTASSDGSRVFFIDTQRLTSDAGTTEGASDLYECEIVEVGGKLVCDLTDLTPEHSGESANVNAPILGASTDGSSVYFVAEGALTGTEENEHGEEAQPGQPNLYRSHDGTTKLIAVLSPKDAPDWGDNLDENRGKIFTPGKGLEDLTGRVSPDGRWLAFMSERSLTGYVNRDASSGKPDEEVYLYHAPVGTGEGALACVSCNLTGARPHGVEYAHLEGGPAGGAIWPVQQWLAASVPGWTSSLYQSRYLSDSGRLFFNASDALVPQDINGTEDVYEFEPSGVGDCGESSATFGRVSGGCVGLVSWGASPEGSGFLDASESGDDAFFLTAAELSSQDSDSAFDVYDAHQCGVSAPCFPPPPPPPPACEGDACQSPVVAPEDPTPGSLTFNGPGNLVSPASTLNVISKPRSKPAKCRKGFVKKKGKCVRKPGARKAKKSAKGRK